MAFFGWNIIQTELTRTNSITRQGSMGLCYFLNCRMKHPSPKPCSGAVFMISLGANSCSDVTIATHMGLVFSPRFPGKTFDGKMPRCYCYRDKKEEPSSPWKLDDNIFYFCSPFYRKKTLMCSPYEQQWNLSPFYKFYKQENWETERGEPWKIQCKKILGKNMNGLKF